MDTSEPRAPLGTTRLALAVRNDSPFVTELTGLTEADLAQGAEPADALAALLSFVDGWPLVAHNGFGYDFKLLDAALIAAGLPLFNGIRLDTLELAHVVFPRAGTEMLPNSDGTLPPTGRSLDALAAHLAIASERATHRAIDDAKLTVAVTLRMLANLESGSPASELRHSQQPSLLTHRSPRGLGGKGPLRVASAGPPRRAFRRVDNRRLRHSTGYRSGDRAGLNPIGHDTVFELSPAAVSPKALKASLPRLSWSLREHLDAAASTQSCPRSARFGVLEVVAVADEYSKRSGHPSAATARGAAIAAGGLQSQRLTVIWHGGTDRGDRGRASLSYRSPTEVPLVGHLIDDVTLSAEVTVRIE
ncbi:MAG: 3'-5' exonuclease [Actinomycetota bacterium]|nr:3'-5' exonuclease [Actinomycetota bacterium]